MPDVVGYRAKWGVIIPSTSTVVEHDFSLVAPPGITCHAGRAYIERPSMASNQAAIDLLDQMDESLSNAVRDVLTLEPDHIIVAMSAEIIRRGVAGVRDFVDGLEQRTQLTVTTGPTAVVEGLRVLGAERIAMVTPYQPVSDEAVRDYFTKLGFNVGKIKGLRCTSATAIARVGKAELAAALTEVNEPDVDVIVQVGTNLSIVELAAEAEHWLGKPVLSMNATTVWHALRRSKFDDQAPGFGVLLRDH